MFPLYDHNKALRPPVATIAVIVVNALVWALLQGFGSADGLARSLCLYGLVPGDLLGLVPPGTRIPLGTELVCQLDGQGAASSIVTSMFMHGGWFHIVGNMWFLWVFGDNVEDVMGPVRFVGFYLLCGLAAAAAQIATAPDSLIPMVGASGAIGGVMGAYALLFPKTRVHTLVFLGFFVTTFEIPAFVMLGYWFLIQVLQGVPSIGSTGGGVAFWAHIGGFLAGIALIHLFKRPDLYAAHLASRRPARSRVGNRWF